MPTTPVPRPVQLATDNTAEPTFRHSENATVLTCPRAVVNPVWKAWLLYISTGNRVLNSTQHWKTSAELHSALENDCFRMALIPRLMQQNSLRKMMLMASHSTTPSSGCLSTRRGRSSVASPLMRSVLFLKGKSSESLYSFSGEARADAYVMDLEDAVPKEKKDSALRVYAVTLESGVFWDKTVYVRLSDINDEARLQMEIDALCHPDLTGFILPKVASSDDIKKTDEILSKLEKKNNLPPGHCKIAPIVETFEALWHAPAIAKASPRLSALINGRADTVACFRKDPLNSPIGKSFMLDVLHAARAAGIPALDGVTYLDNLLRQERHITSGKTLGFEGMCVVHPSMVPLVNQLYSPTRQEIEWAEQKQYRQFIGPLHRPNPSHILETHRKIQALEASVASDGKYSVVTSSHILVNQRDQAVFREAKKTMYSTGMIREFDFAKKVKDPTPTDSEFRSHIIQNATVRVNPETLISRPLAPNQFSYDDMVVPAPMIVAAAVHNVFDDFGDILYEEIVEATHINRVNQEDMIVAVSLIHSVQPLTENSDLEEVTVRTMAIKSLDVDELLGLEVPLVLFYGTNIRPADYEQICREEFPLLYRRIAAQVLWKFLRLRPAATNEAPAGTRPEFS
ncbi:CLYBL [Branchiostoma lanceolatum]|uniref:CLYBL protein n=1 Tax=Branchiostoma lanceolatum TaxID=7740 RepID=A0A8J9ZGI5_BRALA|nr:CLYBL [Branchiostoma lanceolatum]